MNQTIKAVLTATGLLIAIFLVSKIGNALMPDRDTLHVIFVVLLPFCAYLFSIPFVWRNKEKKFALAYTITLLAVPIVFFIPAVQEFVGNLNKVVPNNPNRACQQDSDCTLTVHPDWTRCQRDCCGNYRLNSSKVIAINKEWQPACPFPKRNSCSMLDCVSTIRAGTNGGPVDQDAHAKCIDNQCQKVMS